MVNALNVLMFALIQMNRKNVNFMKVKVTKMGYRHYFYEIPKTEIEEIKKCKTNDDFCNWAESKGYDVDRYEGEEPYCAAYNIGKMIFEFGKYVEWAFGMQEKNESIFVSEELKERYADYCPVICSQEDFLFVINCYKQKIINFYKSLLDVDEIDKAHKITIEEKCERHVKAQLHEWENNFGLCPIDTDLSHSYINTSWLYEYAIFELVRVYKTFDWENNTLMLLGW